MKNHKKILLDRYNKFFGENTSFKLIESIKILQNKQYIRINTSKTTKQEIETFLKKNRVKFENTFLENAIEIKKSFFNLSSSLPALTSKIYFQDIASQVPINVVDFEKLKNLKKTIKILDGCASPGSKTTQLADQLIKSEIPYEIIALEPEKNRINRLINNIQKQEFTNIKILNCKAQEFKTGDKFDLILLDVPCSGNLIGDKNWLNKRSVAGINELSNLQKSIVKHISKYLSEHGELIYSTCSIEPEENEKNIEWIEKNTHLKTNKINLKTPFNSKPLNNIQGLRFLPHKSNTQGFFVAKFINK